MAGARWEFQLSGNAQQVLALQDYEVVSGEQLVVDQELLELGQEYVPCFTLSAWDTSAASCAIPSGTQPVPRAPRRVRGGGLRAAASAKAFLRLIVRTNGGQQLRRNVLPLLFASSERAQYARINQAIEVLPSDIGGNLENLHSTPNFFGCPDWPNRRLGTVRKYLQWVPARL